MFGIGNSSITGAIWTLNSNISNKQDKTTAVTHTASTAVGSATQPVYITSNGAATATTYTLGKSVPSDAVFTDTNTWRPLGTTGDTACAGNDSRLSDSRPANGGNADTVDGLHVHSGRNDGANQIVRTDGNGYIQCGYINSSNGNENNNSNPDRVWGTNGSDSYLRTYRTSALSVNYASSAGNADTVDGHHFYWDGQSGQPSWVWGGNNSTNMYVWDPSNFSVAYATKATKDEYNHRLVYTAEDGNNQLRSLTIEPSWKYAICACYSSGGNWWQYGFDWWESDERLKENIKPTQQNGLDFVNKINHIEFDWNDKTNQKGHVKIGYIAQEIEKIDEDCVYKVPQLEGAEFEEIYQINDTKIIPYLSKAIQELSDIVKEQQKIIEELQEKINK